MKDIFYVYVYFFLDGRPAYVGKGHGDRWRGGHSNKQLNGAVRNAGGSLPVVVVRDGLTEVEAFATEIAFIVAIGRADLGTGPLLNHTDGGQGVVGLRHREELKARMRELKLAFYEDPEARKKISEGTRRVVSDPEVRARTSEAQRRRFEDPEERERHSAVLTGRTLSPEHRAAIGAGLTGGKRSEESRKRMSAWQIGRKMSPEARKKMSEAAKRRFQDPNARRKLSEIATLAAQTPEGKAHLSRMGRLGAAARWSLEELS